MWELTYSITHLGDPALHSSLNSRHRLGDSSDGEDSHSIKAVTILVEPPPYPPRSPRDGEDHPSTTADTSQVVQVIWER